MPALAPHQALNFTRPYSRVVTRRARLAPGGPRGPPCTLGGCASFYTSASGDANCSTALLQADSTPVAYGGWCPRCQTQHSLLPDELALQAAKQLRHQLDVHKRFDFEAPQAEADPDFSTDYVWTQGPGRMLGVMVARAVGQRSGLAAQGEHMVVLKAFSGQMTERWVIPGWVGPVAGITSDHPVYKDSRRDVEAMSAQMHRLDEEHGLVTPASHKSGPVSKRELKRARFQPKSESQRVHWPEWAREQYTLLSKGRATKSQELMTQVQASYLTTTVGGRTTSVLEAYRSYVVNPPTTLQPTTQPTATDITTIKFPAGTGDCCAPKLLHAALQQGLQPLSMCEFWYGSAPSSNTPQGRAAAARRGASGKDTPPSRVHGHVYGACHKCQTILGSLLCPVAT